MFFETEESLVAGDDDTTSDVYERFGGATTGISTDGDDNAAGAALAGASADGARVFFVTANSLSAGDTDDCDGSPGVQGCQDVYEASISPPPPPPAPPGGGSGGGGEAGDTDPPETDDHRRPEEQDQEEVRDLRVQLRRARVELPVQLRRQGIRGVHLPRTLKAGKGKHTFEVRATDAAGNVDPTPATQSWTVKKKKKK